MGKYIRYLSPFGFDRKGISSSRNGRTINDERLSTISWLNLVPAS